MDVALRLVSHAATTRQSDKIACFAVLLVCDSRWEYWYLCPRQLGSHIAHEDTVKSVRSNALRYTRVGMMARGRVQCTEKLQRSTAEYIATIMKRQERTNIIRIQLSHKQFQKPSSSNLFTMLIRIRSLKMPKILIDRIEPAFILHRQTVHHRAAERRLERSEYCVHIRLCNRPIASLTRPLTRLEPGTHSKRLLGTTSLLLPDLPPHRCHDQQ
jgi:hypothetical protein